jgi:hypothetical protein
MGGKEQGYFTSLDLARAIVSYLAHCMSNCYYKQLLIVFVKAHLCPVGRV